MDAALYIKMMSDKSVLDLRKIGYKYPDADMKEFVGLLKSSVYKTLPVHDFGGNNVVYMENIAQIRIGAVKLLLTPQSSRSGYGLNAMESEITSTLMIESINTSRESVRKILHGHAPSDERENRIFGMKNGLEFIADPSNSISEENIFALYDISVGRYLDDADKLNRGEKYRHDTVYVMGQDIEHMGLSHEKLPEYMKRFIDFIRQDSTQSDLIKAAAIHFYFAYLHPYFDGNGRMARLMHMWFLRLKGYSSALFVPFSSYVERSRRQYYNAFALAEANAKISGVMDITPFLAYFIENVYNRLEDPEPKINQLRIFSDALTSGTVTAKEKDLWNFVISAYGDEEFSTKQLERDFANAAYATIRGFVLKFTQLGLLNTQKYSSRVKYRIK